MSARKLSRAEERRLMMNRITRATSRAVFIAALLAGFVATATPAGAWQGDGPVGWEVFSTNTPGGGGELESQGLSGERTEFALSQPGPALPGCATVIVTYYRTKEDLAKAKK